MNTLATFCLLAVLVGAVLADGSYFHQRDGYDYRGPVKGPGYGPGGPKRSKGHGPHGFGHKAGKIPVAFKFDSAPDQLDKILSRLDTALVQVKFLSEAVDSLAARLSLQTKVLNELLLVTAIALKETDERQDKLIDNLWSHLGDLNKDIEDLAAHVDHLAEINHQNVKDQEKAEILWAKERRFDVKQEGEIATLFARVKDFKPKLFQVKVNYFETFYDTVELATVRLSSIKAQENRRMCETGRVTVKSDDRRVEASYQSRFDQVPQVFFGVCGYSVDLDASDDFFHGYGHGYYTPPEAIGLQIMAYSTTSTLIVEGVQKSFGDSKAITADVCYQSCTIDSGVGHVIDHL